MTSQYERQAGAILNAPGLGTCQNTSRSSLTTVSSRHVKRR